MHNRHSATHLSGGSQRGKPIASAPVTRASGASYARRMTRWSRCPAQAGLPQRPATGKRRVGFSKKTAGSGARAVKRARAQVAQCGQKRGQNFLVGRKTHSKPRRPEPASVAAGGREGPDHARQAFRVRPPVRALRLPFRAAPGTGCALCPASPTRLRSRPPRSAPADPFALPPVSPDDPCGPDLDLEGDAEFLNFFAATEGLLPANFYAFQRESIDFPAAFETADKLLDPHARRPPPALLAKLSILNRDVAGFARWIGGIAWLLREHWEGAHPRAEGGDYSTRLGQLMALEDNAVVLLPLQYARLLELAARGLLLLPRPTGGDRRRPAAVGHALQREGREGDERRRKVRRRRRRSKRSCATSTSKGWRSLARRCAAFRRRSSRSRRPPIEHVGYEKAVELPKLDKLVARDGGVRRAGRSSPAIPRLRAGAARAAERGGGGGGGAVAAAPSAFASRAEVDAALASALGYFEPPSRRARRCS